MNTSFSLQVVPLTVLSPLLAGTQLLEYFLTSRSVSVVFIDSLRLSYLCVPLSNLQRSSKDAKYLIFIGCSSEVWNTCWANCIAASAPSNRLFSLLIHMSTPNWVGIVISMWVHSARSYSLAIVLPSLFKRVMNICAIPMLGSFATARFAWLLIVVLDSGNLKLLFLSLKQVYHRQ